MIGPPRRDAFRTFGPDPFDGEKFLRFFFDDVKNVRPESLHKTPGVDGPDPLHHAGTEILFNAVDRGRGRDFENRSLQLPPVLAIRHPSPQRRRVFPGSNGRGMPHHRHQIPVSPHFEPKHAKPVFRVVVRDALDESRYFRSVLRQGFVDDGRIKGRHDGLAENSYCHFKRAAGLLCGLQEPISETSHRPALVRKNSQRSMPDAATASPVEIRLRRIQVTVPQERLFLFQSINEALGLFSSFSLQKRKRPVYNAHPVAGNTASRSASRKPEPSSNAKPSWKGGRVVECTALERRRVQ